ncbi:MAG: S8 family serine peptidase [Cyanobacteria bacterium P01_E01_bin.42]
MFDRLFKFFCQSRDSSRTQFQAFILEPILTLSGLVDVGDDSPLDLDGDAVDLLLPPSAFGAEAIAAFESGYFTVGESGEVEIDFLFDGGKYQFELAIFSLEDLDEIPGSEEFIREAARRALTESTEGHTVISDRLEGAKFDGDLGEGKDWNSGKYLGTKTFKMEAGSHFGVMLIPNSTVEEIYENPSIGGLKAPLFSLSTANPDDRFHLAQIADVTGDGSLFVMEDVQEGHRWFDSDYNDLIFQVRGATGEAIDLDDLIDPAEDWRETDRGKAIINYAEDAIADELALPEVSAEQQPIVGVIDEGEFSGEDSAFSIETEREPLTLGQDRIDGDDNPLLPTGEEAETDILEAIEPESAPLWVGRADGETWEDSLVEFVDEARGSGRENAIAYLALDNDLLSEELGETQAAALTYARENGVLVVAIADGEMGSTQPLPGETHPQPLPRGEHAIAEFDNIVTVGAVENAEKEAAELAGHFARVWAVNPELSYTQVIEILEQTATAVNPETGAAIVDVVAAGYLAAAATPDPAKLRLQPLPDAPYDPESDWQGWESGVFTVGEEGKVTFDFLYDEGIYEGEVAIFDVSGLEEFKPGSPEFITEVTRRILENDGGSVVFSDKTEAVRFASEENAGNYRGIQTVEMGAGREFGLMLVPNGTVAELAENPDLGLSKRPLFSLSPVNPVDGFEGGYLADVTGAGNVLAFEENRNAQAVREYRDLLFTLGGATGNVLLLEEVAPVQDWQDTSFGQIFKKAVSFVESENKIIDSLSSRVRMALKRSQNLDNYNPVALAGTREWVVGISPGQSPTQLAELFGAKYRKATGYIPNTHVWEFPETATPETVAQRLKDFPGLEFGYPLVPLDIQFHSDPMVSQQWHLNGDAKVQEAWNLATGEGVVVGIVDDGFNHQHEDLQDNYRADLSRDFDELNNGTYDTDPSATMRSQEFDYEAEYLKFSLGTVAPKKVKAESSKLFTFDVRSLGTGAIESVDLDLQMTTENLEGLTFDLISPDGDRITLNVDDTNGTISLPIDAFKGQNPAGTWGLEIFNDNQTSKTLEKWALSFETTHYHGTPVAGIAVAKGDNQVGGSGVAPDASWAGLKMGTDGRTDLEIADTLSYLNDDIDLYSNSWGGHAFQTSNPLTEYAMEAAAISGRDGLGNIYVFSAGNNAAKSTVNDDSFANSRHSIAVGAVHRGGKRASYSETGAALFVSGSGDRAYGKLKNHITFPPEPINVKGLKITENTEPSLLEINDFEGDLSDLEVVLNIAHTRYEDLEVTLISPAGTEVKLLDRVPFTQAIDGTALDPIVGPRIKISDDAARDKNAVESAKNPENGSGSPYQGTFRPVELLAVFEEEDPNGTWQLRVKDTGTGETGYLKNWGLSLQGDGVITTGVNDDYTAFGGTSAAAPFVSGVVALMLEANPTLTARDVQHILAETSQYIDDPDATWSGEDGDKIRHSNEYGFGLVDAEAAVQAAKDWQSIGQEIAIRLYDDNTPDFEKGQTSDLESSIQIPELEDDLTVEWVEIEFNAVHPNINSLEVELEHRYFDADGNEVITTSELMKDARHKRDSNWVFTSAHHWGEPSYGTWTLKVKDTQPDNRYREWTDWGLNVYGAKPMVSIEATDPEATEGEDPGEFTIYRTGNVEKDLVVNYEIAGKHMNGTDYEKLPEIIIPAGSSSVTIPIKPLDDNIAERIEGVKLTLTEGQDYEVSQLSHDTVQIWDNEIPEVLVYPEWYNGVSDPNRFQQQNYTSESGNRGYFAFSRSGDIRKDLTVNVSFTGTATNGDDYDLPTSFTIPAGRYESHAWFTPIDDTDVEGNEVVQVDILPSSEYKIVNGRGSQTAVIWDNDDRPTVTIEATDDTASEYGDPGEITITRTGDLSQPLTVDYWVSPHWWVGTDNSGKDFEKLPEQVTIPINQSSVTIPIVPIDDNDVEKEKTIVIFLLENDNYAIGKEEVINIKLFDNDTQQLQWKKQLGTTEYDRANSIAFDSDNNVYIGGQTSGNLDNATNFGLQDGLIAKYDSDGNKKWEVQVGTEGYDKISGIITDKNNNLYVTGWTDGKLEVDHYDEGRDTWLAKYNSAGEQQWKKEFGAPPDVTNPDIEERHAGYDLTNGAITVDDEGNIYVAGLTYGNLGDENQNQGGSDAWVAKFDKYGEAQWVRQFGTSLADEANSLAIDNQGNIYITGQTQGELGDKIYSDGDLWKDHQGDDTDAWVAKYDSSGSQEWIKQLGTITEDLAHSISVNDAGNIYLSGQTRGWFGDVYDGDVYDWKGDNIAWWYGMGGAKEDLGGTYYGETDAWVAQLDADGNLNWKRQLGTEASDRATSVVADSNGNVYLAGNSRGKMDDATHFGKDDAWIAKYDINGALQWRQQYGTDADDVVADIALAGDGIYLTGYTEGKFGENHFGKEDAWVMKLA